MNGPAFRGSLFTNDFLSETIATLPKWLPFDDGAAQALACDLSAIFQRFPTSGRPKESQTEDDLIWPVLGRLTGIIRCATRTSLYAAATTCRTACFSRAP